MRIENRGHVPVASSAGIRREVSDLTPETYHRPVKVDSKCIVRIRRRRNGS